jgi:hypothetical protein
MMLTESEANALKKRYAPHLMKVPGVCGVGVEKDQGGYTVVVHVAAADDATRQQLPSDLDGKSYKVVVSGPFTKY